MTLYRAARPRAAAALRDLAARDGREDEAWRRIAALRTEHARKPTLIERLDKARLVPPRE